MLETPDDVSEISSEQIRSHLEGILLSSTFSHAYRLRNFLQFVVESALTGQYDSLKESSIGVAVFEKSPSFDPRQEPIVRVQARRLRAKLQTYYETEGARDSLVIHFPKGAYVPFFEVREPTSHAPSLLSQETQKDIEDSPLPYPSTAQVTTPPIPAGRLRSVFLFFILVAATIFFAFLATSVSSKHSPVGARPISAHETPLTSFYGKQFSPAISPDGKQVAFVWDGEQENNYDIYVKLLNVGKPIRLTTNLAHDLHPAWSFDGRYIAFLRVSQTQTEVIVIPSLGGAERKIADLHPSSMMWSAVPTQMSQNPGPIWTHDDQSLIVSDGIGLQASEALFSIPLDGSPKKQITVPTGVTRDLYPSLSPDGKTIAFVRQTSEQAADVFVVSVSGGAPHQLTFDKMDVRGITWKNDGKVIIFSSNRGSSNYGLWGVPTGGGGPTAIPVSAEQATDPFISPVNGDLAYTDTIYTSSIWRQRVTGASSTKGRAERLISSSRRDSSPKYSPDGQYIAFTSDRSGSWEIWTSKSNGTDAEQITSFGGAMVGSPNWAPDGRSIIFDARPNGRSVIYAIPAVGGTPKALTSDDSENKLPTFSNDGKWIFFASGRNGLVQLWKMPAQGGTASQVTSAICHDAFESPDGQKIFFESRSRGVWQVPAEGGYETLVPGLETVYPSRYMTVANGSIYFVRSETSPRLIERYVLRDRRIETLGNIDHDLVVGTRSLTVSPDSKWVVYAQQDHSSSNLMLVKGFKDM